MPVSPALAKDLAARVRELYDEAEGVLLERLAAALEADIDSPRWAELKLASVGNLRTAVEEVAAALQTDTTGAVAEALITAYNRGRQAAVAELGALDIGRELDARRALPNAPAVDRLAASYAQDTRPLYQRITRSIVDTYRSIVARVSGAQLLTGITRRDASQRALNTFAQHGITGFVDSAGRNWDMASYAEMAVRSVTARAAIEGHIDSLAEIRIGLVIVSDAPLECPLCRPWEGEILTLGAASGPHTVRAQHELHEDGRTVAVHVAGSLIEARAAGLFHPNCRHSLGAYLPGVTTRPPHHATPGTTYEDTQRQREIERHIRAWKRRAAAAMDDTARRKANAKVREWQKAAREHVAAHEDLRRKREREQLPKATTQDAPAPETIQAARLRTDPGAARRMSEDELAAAVASGLLGSDGLRLVEAEMDRRDEARRRDMVFPGGRLTDALSDLDDDTLAWATGVATAEDVTRIAAEFDRRYPPDPLPQAAGSQTVAGQLADRAAVDEVLAPMADPDDWAHLSEDLPDDPREGLSSAERWAAEREDEQRVQSSAYTRDQLAEMYREHIYAQYLTAEDELRGVLLSRVADVSGIDPISLFTGPAHVAYAHASEELKRWWVDNPRTTLAEYTEQATGQRSAAGDTARASRNDQQNRL